MKVKVTKVEETVYEIDVAPAAYCNFRATYRNNAYFQSMVLNIGTVTSTSRTWKNACLATEKDEAELNDFLLKRAEERAAQK